jgi:hypothetical protein
MPRRTSGVRITLGGEQDEELGRLAACRLTAERGAYDRYRAQKRDALFLTGQAIVMSPPKPPSRASGAKAESWGFPLA